MDTENAFEIRLPASTQIVRIQINRSGRAKRMTIRIKANGSVCIVMPDTMRGDVLEKARMFALKNLDWIDRQLEKIATREPAIKAQTLADYLAENPKIFAGERVFNVEISMTFARPFYVFRPQENVLPIYVRPQFSNPDLQACLKTIARQILPEQVKQLAEACRVSVGKISVRNQQSRWGSCSTHGDISLNWRLILVESAIQKHVILHELAHRRHMNHSDDFWDLLTRWDPQTAGHDADLRQKWSQIFNLSADPANTL